MIILRKALKNGEEEEGSWCQAASGKVSGKNSWGTHILEDSSEEAQLMWSLMEPCRILPGADQLVTIKLVRVRGRQEKT